VNFESTHAIFQFTYTSPEKFCTISPEAEMGQNFSGELYQRRIN